MVAVDNPRPPCAKRAVKHKKFFLEDFEPCLFRCRPDVRKGFEETTVDLNVKHRAIQEFCSRHGVSPCNLIQTAWAIVIIWGGGCNVRIFHKH
ncbi:hypothetical protein EYZ11_012138 [Aspergillus tanneri]|uniref:Uncharacterized protein n=1 Tax=Aspergillus tanneri TaxID=1220188 RepID=A0A4S3J101_9EURO|nr:hypothetical protein EYZ11_012138 [Aspergillus tanneri]